MSIINTIVVDDEYPALMLMSSFVKRLPYLHLAAELQNAEEALQYTMAHKPDLLMMDIQMPGLDGITLLNKLPPGQVCIFFTANPAHAAQAYELDVVDYVLKPFTFERFSKAVEKARQHIELKKNVGQEKLIQFKADYMHYKVPISQVRWIEGFGEYIKIITSAKSYLVLQRLTEFEKTYNTWGFVRIHKSYIVHRDSITSFNSQYVKLKDGEEIPIGRFYKQKLDL